ncbi:MAG: DEAD/DEAH box helicase [Spirochaetia bacterium]|jgi:ATP-dependent RNA helicase RhlB|nr:DEAD/DEAH box helicase [Spirochaetia bacterium]
MKFTELPFEKIVLKGVEAAGFETCTEVQEKVLPVSLAGKDLMVQSKTGSGKTAVYALTILQRFALAEKQGKPKTCALVVAPTRELAVQIEKDVKLLGSGFESLVVGCFYGGVGYEEQKQILQQGCDIYVGTPGRLLDFQKSGKIDFRLFDIFVLDEADRMFDMGFYPDVQEMFAKLRPCKDRQTMLFSATLSTRVRNLAWSYMNEAEEIEIEPEEICVDKITQELYHVAKSDKFQLFLQLMTKYHPENALIFTNTKAMAVEVAKRLTLNGFLAKYLMGDMPQSKRLATLDKMKEGKLKFLVATDVAARGLQIDDLELVVNYDIPEDFENYVHRIGRTARAGNTGKAVTLACEQYIYGLEPIENYIHMKIPVIWPEEGSLPEVEDKSKGYSFRDLVSEREYASHGNHDRRKGDGRGSAHKRNRSASVRRTGRNGHSHDKDHAAHAGATATSKRPTRPQQQRPYSAPGKEDYKKIQSMSLEERLDYYKRQYVKEGGSFSHTDGNRVKGKAPLQEGQRLCQDQETAAPVGKARRPERKPKSSGTQKSAHGNVRNTKAPVRKKAPAGSKAAVPAKVPVSQSHSQKKGLFARIFGR